MKTKVCVFSIVTLLNLLFTLTVMVFSQELSINTEPEGISEKTLLETFKLVIRNNLNDTLLIPASPFKIEIVDDKEYCYSSPRFGTLSNNSITFFKKNIKLNEVNLYNPISYLRFPEILVLLPFSKVEIVLVFDNDVLDILKDYSWDINCNILYVNNNEINKVLNTKYKEYEQEFKEAQITKDTIFVRPILDKQYSLDNKSGIFDRKNDYRIGDSTLYFYKDGEKFKFMYSSAYDDILSYFNIASK